MTVINRISSIFLLGDIIFNNQPIHFCLYFKFIAHAIDAFHIFRQVGGYPELLSKIAYVIVDRFPGIVGIVLMPYQFQKHFIGEYSLGVQYEQSKNLKFLNRQRNYLAPHSNKALL